jgi:hypothetical protein
LYFQKFLKINEERHIEYEKLHHETLAKLDKLQQNFVKNEPLWKKAGSTYELVARGIVSQSRGPAFAKKVTIQSLTQLAEVCLPSRYDVIKKKPIPQSKMNSARKQMSDRATTLARLALEQVPYLEAWVNLSQSKLSKLQKNLKDEYVDSVKRKLGLVSGSLIQFNDIHDDFGKLMFLRDDRLGFFCFSRLLLTDPDLDGFVEELDLDIAGSVTVQNNVVSYTVGEIKSGNDCKQSITQLAKRLGIMYLATVHILPESEKFTFTGTGIVYNPYDWKDPDPQLIEACKVNTGIKEFPSTMTFEMETIN